MRRRRRRSRPGGGIFAHAPPWPATPPAWANGAGLATGCPTCHPAAQTATGSDLRTPATSGRPPERVGQAAATAKVSGNGRIWPGKKETAPGNDLPALGDRLPPATTGDRVPPWAHRSGRGASGASGARNRPKGDTGRFGAAGTTPAKAAPGPTCPDLAGFGRGKKETGGVPGVPSAPWTGSCRGTGCASGCWMGRRERHRPRRTAARMPSSPPKSLPVPPRGLSSPPDGFRVGLGGGRAAARHTGLF